MFDHTLHELNTISGTDGVLWARGRASSTLRTSSSASLALRLLPLEVLCTMRSKQCWTARMHQMQTCSSAASWEGASPSDLACMMQPEHGDTFAAN